MLLTNSDVSQGLANGSQATFNKLVLKAGVRPRKVMVNGIPVNAVFASEVIHVVLNHSNARVQPQQFPLPPEEQSFTARIVKPSALQTKGMEREGIRMKAVQLPIIVNHATTGHKLQGCGVDDLFVHGWHYKTNWPYVMLSRVKTKMGLYARKKISADLTKYKTPRKLDKLISHFRKKAPTYWSNWQYRRKFGNV